MSGSYLVPGTGPDGTQLWVVTVAANGVASSQELVDLYPGAAYSAFEELGASAISSPYFTASGNGFLFVAAGLADETQGAGYGAISATGTQTGRELWYTDGTAAGTHLVYDFYAGTKSVYNPATYQQATIGNDGFSASPEFASLANGTTLFIATTANGTELFGTRGSSANTYQITTDNFTAPAYLTSLGNEAVFEATLTATDGTTYTALFASDGVNATRVSTESNIVALTKVNGGSEALFSGLDGQLWVTNGTTTTELTTTAAITGGPIIDLGNGTDLFFSGSTLWVTNGTPGGTTALTALPGQAIGTGHAFTEAGGAAAALFTTGDGSGGYDLWVSNGAAGGTARLGGSTVPPSYVVAGSTVLFTETDTTGVTSLMSTTGGAATQLAASGVGGLKAGPTGEAIFNETDSSGTITLFITNGAAAGTHAITAPGLTYIGNYTANGADFFFTAKDSTGAYGVWEVGTTGNATELDINGDTYPGSLSVVGGDVFFNATNATTGAKESWVANGALASLVTGGVITGGNAATSFSSTALACFLIGTRLATPDGPVAVEDLREGDLVLTASGAAAPVIWIGERDVDLTRHPSPDRVRPVRIRRGAFAESTPARDLLVSPDHAIALDGALIPAGHLIDGVSIIQERPARAHYFHVELPAHDVILAEGLAVESYLDTGNRDCFDGGAAVTRLHPDFWALHWDAACAPLVLTGPRIEAARARLRDRAALALAA